MPELSHTSSPSSALLPEHPQPAPAMDDATTSTIDPTCRASNTAADNGEAPAEQRAFRHGYWTPDGTSLLATTDKDKLETYIV